MVMLSEILPLTAYEPYNHICKKKLERIRKIVLNGFEVYLQEFENVLHDVFPILLV